MAILKFSIRFNLQQNKLKSKETSLRCIVRFNNNRAIFGTNIQIEPRFFNTNAQSVRNSAIYDGTNVTKSIRKIVDFVTVLFEEYNSYPDPKDVELVCKNFISSPLPDENDLTNKELIKKVSLIAFLEESIDKMESGEKRIAKGSRRGIAYKKGTIKGYRSVLEIFKRFAIHSKRKDYTFDEVNKEFYNNLQTYFYDELKYSSGYFATVIKTLKTVMGDAQKNNLHFSSEFKSDHFVKPEYESDTIYLSIQQLELINNCELEHSYLRNARDVFLVGCWTGLRFSDFSRLELTNIEDGYIRIMTEKMGDRVAIPIHPVLKQVFERNGGNFPKGISNQKLNTYIKIVAERAKLSKQISIKKNVGGVDVYEEVDFCSLVTTHTARRSFATNMFKLNIPTLIIMAITGHKTEKSFLKYIRVSNEEKAQIMREMWKKLGWE